MPTEVLYWGLKISEWLTLFGVIIGPIVAVAITLWVESQRRRRENKTQILRLILNTRHLAADPQYSTAINLIPVEFSSSLQVMTSWKEYIQTVNEAPQQEQIDQHSRKMNIKQTALIFQMMKSLGYKTSESDIQLNPYISSGFIQRDNLYLDSLRATREIADNLKANNKFLVDATNGAANRISK